VSIDGDAEPEMVSAPCAMRRALVLAALVCRGNIEPGAEDAEAISLHARILDWATFLNLEEELESDELRILQAPLGTLSPREVSESTWAIEGLAILSWALNLRDLPKHDEKVDPFGVTDSVCFLSDEAAELVASARLRSPAEFQAYREVAYAVHCRLRDFVRNRNAKDFATWVEKAWLEGLQIDPAHLIVGGDLGVGGAPILDAEANRVQACEWITFQRHRAIIWLLGDSPVYSKTPVDT
jgi:hypothetical protein